MNDSNIVQPLLPQCLNGDITSADFNPSVALNYQPNTWAYYQVRSIILNHAPIFHPNIYIHEFVQLTISTFCAQQSIDQSKIHVNSLLASLQSILPSTIPGIVLGALSVIGLIVTLVWVRMEFSLRSLSFSTSHLLSIGIPFLSDYHSIMCLLYTLLPPFVIQ